jgi:4-hydroxythreonine-4-phosphate dehydrogenase
MESPSSRPLLALTLGDPSGIGPEVVLKAVMEPEAGQLARYVVVGPAAVALATRDRLRLPVRLTLVTSEDALAGAAPDGVPVLSISDEPAERFPVGEVCAASGRAAVMAVEKAARLALAGKVDALVTAPLNKEAMQLAGYSYPGHTEILGELCGAKATMLLASPQLRVVHVSVHCSLQEAIRRVTRENVRALIGVAGDAARKLGVERPRIAVAGLNPHAGEGGMFGREEIEEIAPAVQDARASGWDVSGPWPPDTIFLRASQGEWDIIVAMYHDQGHIAVKMLGLEDGVNVTLGLPVIRTSVDHGTAFDIAGRGIAQHASMMEAIRVAVRMVRSRGS